MKLFPLFLILATLTGCASPFNKPQKPAYPHNQGIQKIVDEEVSSSTKKLRSKSIAVVVAEPKTGKILAMSGPVIWDLLEPGSTFKPFVIAAALQEGKITAKTEIFCENGTWNLYGKKIKDHHGSGNLTYTEILQKSSNIGASKIGVRLDDKTFDHYVRQFGFGEKTGIAVADEISGIVNPPQRWNALTKARNSFGQSIAVTPIQLAMGYCALANGGKLMKPVVGDEKHFEIRRVVSKRVADEVKNALQGCVSDQGTAPLAKVDGVSVGGKTGTAQLIAPTGGYYADRFVTSFAGFFPVESPKYVIVVVVTDAHIPPENNYGGIVAAPIFSRIAGKILKIGNK